MDKIYQIQGLDCANCAAKLERHLQEITEFQAVNIDFMGQKLILTVAGQAELEHGLEKAKQVIAKVEPGVILTEKGKKKAAIQSTNTSEHGHNHGEGCECGHDHDHRHDHSHGEGCECGHDHGHQHDHSHGEGCECGHDHGHEREGLTEQDNQPQNHAAVVPEKPGIGFRREIIRLLFGGVLFLLGAVLHLPDQIQLLVYLTAYLIVGADVLMLAGKNILRGQVFDENFLMAIATVGAFLIGEYPEGVAVMLFYQVGELFQHYAVDRSRRSIADLMDIRPDVAYVQKNGSFVPVHPEAVAIGDVIMIKPGEKIPLDGIVIKGTSELDTKAITGETVLRSVEQGDTVLSGCINSTGVLNVRVEKEFGDSTVAKILDLVENASSKKAQTEKFITRFARYYTPVVVMIAAFLAIFPPLLFQQEFSGWIYRALVFLVISCPCALVISIPLSFFGGLGACSKHGILIKGSNYLEVLAQVDTVIFDKTGTLTKGSFRVTEIHPNHCTADALLEYAAYGESYSTHPIAMALRNAYQQKIDPARIGKIEEDAGRGVHAVIDGKMVLVGNQKLMKEAGIASSVLEAVGTVIYIAVEGTYMGCIVIADEIKTDAARAIEKLQAQGIRKTVMLTGDSKHVGEQVARQLAINEVYSELLPGDKVEKLEQLMSRQNGAGKIAFVGDGINDAPVLARADVGVAMGGLGSDAAIEAADVVIMNDEPAKLADAIKLARKTLVIAKQNIIFTLAVKLIVLLAGMFGLASMWAAVFADVGVAFIAILNAVRVLGTKVE